MTTVYDIGTNHLNQRFIMMELCSESLEHYLKVIARPMVTSDVNQLLRHMSYALVELKALRIIHRDIKPANILISREKHGQLVFKLTDFGISRFWYGMQSVPDSWVRTDGYYAPEVLDGHAFPLDIWSLGVVLIECALGKRAFDGHNYLSLCQNLPQLQTVVEQLLMRLEPDLRLLLSRMVKVDANDRVTCHELVSHDWSAAQSFNLLDDAIICQILSSFGFANQEILSRVNKNWRHVLRRKDEVKTRNCLFNTLDNLVLRKIFYYTTFEDRVRYERVRKKWQELLQLPKVYVSYRVDRLWNEGLYYYETKLVENRLYPTL